MKDLIIIGKGRAMLMAFMLVAYMLGICSCDHKDLCMNHSHMVDVDVSFDWSYAPDADPVAMVVQFFRVDDGRQCYRCEFSPARKGETGRGLIKGGKVRIPAGEYRILFHNNDIERMDERGDTYAGCRWSSRSWNRWTVGRWVPLPVREIPVKPLCVGPWAMCGADGANTWRCRRACPDSRLPCLRHVWRWNARWSCAM